MDLDRDGASTRRLLWTHSLRAGGLRARAEGIAKGVARVWPIGVGFVNLRGIPLEFDDSIPPHMREAGQKSGYFWGRKSSATAISTPG